MRTFFALISVFASFLLFSAQVHAQTCDLFPHGVAAFEVSDDEVTLWTRYTGDNLEWEISTNKDFTNVVQADSCHRGDCLTGADSDFTVKIGVVGLQSGIEYFYRFDNGSALCRSSVGRFVTAPAKSTPHAFKFALTGDAWLPSFNAIFGDYGFQDDMCPNDRVFGIMKRIAERNYDFFVFLGDTVYADYFRGNGINLDDYREAYKLTREENYMASLESTSVYAQYDDHEVADNWNNRNISSQELATAIQAFQEYFHVPQATFDASACRTTPLYRVIDWGQDLDVFMLDTRSCRQVNTDVVFEACKAIGESDSFQPLAGCGFNGELHCVPELSEDFNDLRASNDATFSMVKNLLSRLGGTQGNCLDALRSSERSMLGSEQLSRFKQDLLASNAKFKIITSQVPLSKLYYGPYDRWEAFPEERDDILSFIADNQIEGVVFVSTDVHFNMINELRIENSTGTYKVAPEIIVGPIAAYTLEQGLKDELPDLFNYLNTEYKELIEWTGNTAKFFSDTTFEMSSPENLYEVLITSLMTVARGRSPIASNFNQYAYTEFEYTGGDSPLTISIRDCAGNKVASAAELSIEPAPPRLECEGVCSKSVCANQEDRAEDGLYCLVDNAQETGAFLDKIFGDIYIAAPEIPNTDMYSLASAVLEDGEPCSENNPAACATGEWDVYSKVIFDVDNEVADFTLQHAVLADAEIGQSIESAVDATEQYLENDANPYISCTPGLEFVILHTQTNQVSVLQDRTILLSQIPNVKFIVNSGRVIIKMPQNPENLRIFVKGTTSTPQNYECSAVSYVSVDLDSSTVDDKTVYEIPSTLLPLEKLSVSQQLSVFNIRSRDDSLGEFYFDMEKKLGLRFAEASHDMCFVTTRGDLDLMINGQNVDAKTDFSNDINANTDGCMVQGRTYDSDELKLREFCTREFEYDDNDERSFYHVEMDNDSARRKANVTYFVIARQPTSQSWYVEFYGHIEVNEDERSTILLSQPQDGVVTERAVYSPEFGVVPLSQVRKCDFEDDDSYEWGWWILGAGLLFLSLLAFAFFAGLVYFLWLLTRPGKTAPPLMVVERTTQYVDEVVPV
eukprot:CAMPEP_0117442950 /NCGR_PEP_ID=MMETSP0759-20121206/4429_1 /TAXON_ID=63605 /ORGANISM="Percolomonas cosmopolitus, Strain WS" /LENGTH=1077 /DNA_ID=CAMNT_0005234881 /DNA_START=109 /DNA_END=3342 /DNA_ORIENTATION=-